MSICRSCKFWGTGDGTGNSYDAGHMNQCNQPQITGSQHPSNGVGSETRTMVYAIYWKREINGYAGSEKQVIETRWNFGCNLHEASNGK